MNIQVNDCVTILGHVGIIDDIAKSENGRTLILWRSLKGIWNHHPQEWIDITDENLLLPMSQYSLEKDIRYYRKICIDMQKERTEELISELIDAVLSLGDKGE